MPNVKKIGEVNPEDTGWELIEEYAGESQVVGFENPDFGRIYLKAVLDDEGAFLWDQPTLDLETGAVMVPYHHWDDGSLEVMTLTHLREVPRDPETGEQGRETYEEVPRGFGFSEEGELATVMRELGEETGIYDSVESVENLGEINPDTAWFEKPSPVYAVEVAQDYDTDEYNDSDDTERILEAWMRDYEDLRAEALEMSDGFTLAALFKFDCWIEQNPEFDY